MLQPKDTDWLNGYKNKSHIYAVYKKPTPDQRNNRLKVRRWKNLSCKWEAKESWSSNPHIRQNRP